MHVYVCIFSIWSLNVVQMYGQDVVSLHLKFVFFSLLPLNPFGDATPPSVSWAIIDQSTVAHVFAWTTGKGLFSKLRVGK